LVSDNQAGNKAALVRYVPPNPNYVPPVAATNGGCGKALPFNITANGPSVQFGMTPSDGIPRTYLVHIPQYYDINKALPIIFGFHGNGGTAGGIQDQTGFNDGVLNPYAITVYVQGVGSGQAGYESNPGYGSSADPGTFNNGIRDREFLKQLVRSMQDNFCIDPTRIFAAGHSNGGGFCGVIACDPELSITFAAIAPNSGAFYSGTAGGTADPDLVITDTPGQIPCSPGRLNMAIFETHGTLDPTISYFGDRGRGSPSRVVPSIPRWLNAWAARQGMSLQNYTTQVAPNATLVQWANANGGELGRLQHFRLEDWVHQWPDGKGTAPINLSPYIMEFFNRWPNPNNRAPSPSSVTSSTASSTSSLSASSSSSSLIYSNSSSSLVASSTSSSLTNSS
jgi:poly(3-hydroxybutyrate) depolymerase